MLSTKEKLNKKHKQTIDYCLDLLEELNEKYDNDLILSIWWFGSSENGTNNESSDTDIAIALNNKYDSKTLRKEIANLKIDLKELDFDYPQFTSVDLVSKFIDSNESLEEYVNKHCTTHMSYDIIWRDIINGTKLK